MTSQKITIALQSDLFQRMERLIDEKRFPNRNHFIQEALREKLESLETSRLAHELAKLDIAFEQKIANDDLGDGAPEPSNC